MPSKQVELLRAIEDAQREVEYTRRTIRFAWIAGSVAFVLLVMPLVLDLLNVHLNGVYQIVAAVLGLVGVIGTVISRLSNLEELKLNKQVLRSARRNYEDWLSED